MGGDCGASAYWPRSSCCSRWACHAEQQAWTRVSVPDANGVDYVSGLAVAGTNDLWMAGGHVAGTHPESWEWDGTAWSFVSVPSAHPESRLGGVAALPTGEVWAVGQWFDWPGGAYHALAYHRCDTWERVRAEARTARSVL